MITIYSWVVSSIQIILQDLPTKLASKLQARNVTVPLFIKEFLHLIMFGIYHLCEENKHSILPMIYTNHQLSMYGKQRTINNIIYLISVVTIEVFVVLKIKSGGFLIIRSALLLHY